MIDQVDSDSFRFVMIKGFVFFIFALRKKEKLPSFRVLFLSLKVQGPFRAISSLSLFVNQRYLNNRLCSVKKEEEEEEKGRTHRLF